MHSRISFIFSNQFLFFFLSISSEAGLEIDSQQEEEPVQASDESDLPSTSQDPPSSSSVGKFQLLTTCSFTHHTCLKKTLILVTILSYFFPEF